MSVYFDPVTISTNSPSSHSNNSQPIVAVEEKAIARKGAALKRFLAEAPAVDVPPTEELPGQKEFASASKKYMWDILAFPTENMGITMPTIDEQTLAQNRAKKKELLQQALGELTLAIQKRPDDFLYYQMRAEVLIALQQYSEAMKDLYVCINAFQENTGFSWEGETKSTVGPQGNSMAWYSAYKMPWRKCDAYWDLYKAYRGLGQKDSPEAQEALKIAADLGSVEADGQIRFPDLFVQ